MHIYNKHNYKKQDKNKVDVLESFLWILWRKEVEFKLTVNQFYFEQIDFYETSKWINSNIIYFLLHKRYPFPKRILKII